MNQEKTGGGEAGDELDRVRERQELVADGLDRVREAAGFLRVSVSHVYALMERGELPYVKIGKSRRVPHRAVVELAARNLVSR